MVNLAAFNLNNDWCGLPVDVAGGLVEKTRKI